MKRIDWQRGSRTILVMLLVALLGAALTAAAYWPGLMTWDSMREYREGLSGDIDDWHPPVVEWLWGRLARVVPGPAPMLVLQLALYWGGLWLLAAEVRRAARERLGWAVLACGFLPLAMALMGAILKDSLMAGALLVAAGLLAVRLRGGGGWVVAFAIAALLFAATLRFNAFAACLPLLVVLLPRAWWRTWPRLIATSIVATAALMAAMPIANRLIGAKPSGVELSLVIFDLGGITEHAGVDVFPHQLGVADAVRVNHRCYRPDKWDSYSDWVDPVCPLGFTAWNDRVAPAGVKPYPFWLRAVIAHPLAYAEHRLTHFAINTRLVPIADSVERPVQVEGPPNDWGYHVTPNPALHAIDAMTVASAHTPLGWPILWIALALGALVVGTGPGPGPGSSPVRAEPVEAHEVHALRHARGERSEDRTDLVSALTVPLALSSILYGCGYLVFSVAVELRYHLWTELAALLATVLVAREWRTVPRRRLILAYLPAAIILIAATAFRL